MKAKHKPRYVVLTDQDIAIAEFKHTRELKNWITQYYDPLRPIKKILTGRDIKTAVYLPLF